MAGSLASRISDFRDLLVDPGVDALLGSWGGKSCNQLVPSLPYAEILEMQKPIVGFSDVGVLLNHISVQTGLVTYYGPNIAGKLVESAHGDMAFLQNPSNPNVFGQTASEHWQTVVPGSASGRLLGGNLSTFVLGMVGTATMDLVLAGGPWIFFWESASEPPQIIDQYLACLQNAGFFENVAGMIVGDATYEEVDRKNRPLDELLADYSAGGRIPVARIETFGHRPIENPPIPVGAEVHMDNGERTVRLNPATT